MIHPTIRHYAGALAAAMLLAAAPPAAQAQHAAAAAAKPLQKFARTGRNKTPPPVVKTAKAAPQSLRYLLSESP